ncbi:MAG TPA: response regulator, partial [Verrucomicrobiae bacterium]
MMKTILVLSPRPDFAEALRAGLNPEQFRVVHRVNFEEADPLLAHGLVQACILDLEMTGVQGVWALEKIRRRDAKCPIVIYTDAKHPEWEEEAYLQGVTHVLNKPVRTRMLAALLERIFVAPVVRAAPLPPPPQPVSADTTRFYEGPPAALAAASQTADVLRDFSSILTHSLDSAALLRQFLLLLRRLVGLNRAVVFLRQPCSEFGELVAPADSRRLRAACAIGVSPSLLEHFELSLDAGIGGQSLRLGRILRRNSEEVRNEVEAQKEFELLGGQVAVPMFDRETLLGVAVLDGRVTGEPLVNAELELIFHLLEQVSLAIRNIWLHDQLAGNHELMTGVLRELSSACIVVSRDLKIQHANKTARRFFAKSSRPTGEIEFTDLPQPLATKVYQVLRTGTAIPPFKFEPEGERGAVFNISVVPFQRETAAQPASALLIADDLTQSEQLRKLEVEASNLRLVKTMADRLAHEVGNAMVPLSTHQQLLAEKFKDAEFRASLNAAMADGVKRVTRLINQMRFLSRDSLVSHEAFPLEPLIEE